MLGIRGGHGFLYGKGGNSLKNGGVVGEGSEMGVVGGRGL